MPAAPCAEPGPPGSQPPPAPAGRLIGRETEFAAVGELLASSRMVTLTGPPGVGKTRLALAVAAAAGTPVAWVDLSRVGDAQVAATQLQQALRPGAAAGLLVVDNFEHVLDAAPALADLVARFPQVRALVTSRERLHLSGEVDFAVPPLRMPGEADLADLDRLARTPAVALLLDRSALALTAANARDVAEVCVRLDGLPLALELAAARLRVFAPAELVGRLEDRLSLLTGGPRDVPQRHRALRAAIAWSHELLAPAEQAALRRLSVFVGGWTLPAAATVCALPEPQVIAVVESLVDKSLVRAEPREDAVEFRLLDSVREFAAAELAAAGETADVRARHGRYYAGLATRCEAGIGSGQEPEWVIWCAREHGNLAAAVEFWRSCGGGAQALRVAVALGWYHYTRGLMAAGAAVVEAAMADVGEHAAEDDVLAAALIFRALFAREHGELEDAAAALRRARVISVRHGDRRREANASAFLGHVARALGRFDEAAEWYRHAGDIYVAIDNPRGVAWSLQDRGLLARDRGRLAEAHQLLYESLRLFRSFDYPWACAWSAWGIGTVHLRRGAVEEAAAMLTEALTTFAAVDDRRGLAQSLEALALLIARRGAAAAALRVASAAGVLRERVGAVPSPEERAAMRELAAHLTTTLGDTAADREGHAGATMPLADAIALAIAAATRPAGAVAPGPALTNREREVADLIAAGSTNRQLARALGISEKTAEVHVRNIMAKLETSSRAGIAAWAAGHPYGFSGIPAAVPSG